MSHEEEYFDEEGMEDEYLEDELYEQSDLPWWVKKAPSVLISLGIHGVILIIMAYITMMQVANPTDAELLTQTEHKVQEYDEEKERDLVRTPEILHEQRVEHPVLILEEETEITTDIPRGTSWDNLSNKNLNSEFCVDAYGIGGGAAGAYGARYGRGSVHREGGSPGTESAVLAALRWLRFHQDRNGGWDIQNFSRHCRQGETCDGKALATHFHVGASALALLAFLGNGQTHMWGQFRPVVHRAIGYMQANQDADGCYGRDPEGRESWFYNHALGLMAMCEVYAMTNDPALRSTAERALKFGLDAQNPGAGWRYEPRGGQTDTSVTGWMILALKAAETAGFNVPREAYQGSLAWFDRVTDTNGRTGYITRGDRGSRIRGRNCHFDRDENMTAVAVLCRIFAGQSRNNRVIQDGVKLIMADLPNYNAPSHSSVNYYHWYNATYAMFQVGGNDWRTWNESMKKALLDSQRRGGCADGSWDSVGTWCVAGGRVYATAINALTLQIYYRFRRVQETGGG